MSFRNTDYRGGAASFEQIAEMSASIGSKGFAQNPSECYWKFNYQDGTPINLRLFSKVFNDAQTAAYVDSLGSKADRVECYMIAPPITDDLIRNILTGSPVLEDPYDRESYINTNEQRMDAYARALGASRVEMPMFDMAGKRMDDPVEMANRANDPSLGAKALTSTSPWLHAIADDKVSMLFLRPYPWQASIPVEAVRGKEVKFDVAQPYALMGGGFGTEDPTLTESDFEMKTRSDIVKYSYVTGRVTDAAMKEGATAYPPRDYWSIASENAVNSSRSIRERSMLGVTRNPQTIASSNVYEAATSLEYDGIHQMITRSTGAYSTWTNNLAQTAPITSVDTAAQAIVKLEDQLVQSAQKLLVMGIQPNLMMCDMSTFSLFREKLMKTQFGVPPTADYAFGISFIQYALPGMPTLNLIQHPFLPYTVGSRATYLVDTNLLAMRAAWRDNFEILAKNNPSQKFFISSAECFIDKSDGTGTSSLMGGVFNY